MGKNIEQIGSLTPLRGIAALWVVVFHYDEFLNFMGFGHLVDRDVSSLIGKGYLLVDFFFLLSGFVIFHVYGSGLGDRNSASTKRYLWARFTRLYPMHLFAMLAMLLQFLWLKGNHAEYAKWWEPWYPTSDFFVYLLFGQSNSVLSDFSWNLPSWSIAAEWWTYVLAILFIPYLEQGVFKRTFSAVVIAFAGLAVMFVYNGMSLDFTIKMGVLRCLFSFVIGVGIYQTYRTLPKGESVWSRDWLFAIIVMCTIIAMSYSVPDILIVPLFALVILSAAMNTQKVAKFLNTRPLVILGDISYSIYLMQIFWLSAWSIWVDLGYRPAHPDITPDLPVKLVWLLGCIAVLLVSSYVTYHWVELPAQRRLRVRFKG